MQENSKYFAFPALTNSDFGFLYCTNIWRHELHVLPFWFKQFTLEQNHKYLTWFKTLNFLYSTDVVPIPPTTWRATTRHILFLLRTFKDPVVISWACFTLLTVLIVLQWQQKCMKKIFIFFRNGIFVGPGPALQRPKSFYIKKSDI